MSISRSKRFRILRKCKFTCFYCGRSAPDVALEIDHIVPVSKGGRDDERNLVAACWDCNRGKRDADAIDRSLPESLAEWKFRITDEWLDDSIPDDDPLVEIFRSEPMFMRPIKIDFDLELAASEACPSRRYHDVDISDS